MRAKRYQIGKPKKPKGNKEQIAIDKPSELKIALDNRMLEIQMFWQRSNYFLVLITAVGVAVFSLKDSALAVILSAFGAVSSYYWYKTNLGSKFWQESWEVEVVKLSREEGIASFERSTKDILRQVEMSLDASGESNTKTLLHRYFDSKIAKKPSVSYYMILLSVASTVVWSLVTVILFLQVNQVGSAWVHTVGVMLGIVAAVFGFILSNLAS